MNIREVCECIDGELAGYSGSSSSLMQEVRSTKLQQLGQFLRTFGFPRTKRERYETCLHPYFFQEAIYDDLDPWTRQGNLGQLLVPYTIDLAVQTGGERRDSISDKEFGRYVSELECIVAWRQGRAGLIERLLLWSSKNRARRIYERDN